MAFKPPKQTLAQSPSPQSAPIGGSVAAQVVKNIMVSRTTQGSPLGQQVMQSVIGGISGPKPSPLGVTAQAVKTLGGGGRG